MCCTRSLTRAPRLDVELLALPLAGLARELVATVTGEGPEPGVGHVLDVDERPLATTRDDCGGDVEDVTVTAGGCCTTWAFFPAPADESERM